MRDFQGFVQSTCYSGGQDHGRLIENIHPGKELTEGYLPSLVNRYYSV